MPPATNKKTHALSLAKIALKGVCPRCAKGELFKGPFSIAKKCNNCGLDFSRYAAGDGPASFMIFIYGALIVPLAFLLESLIAPPLWVHVIVWGGVMLVATLLSLRPLKAGMVALQFRLQTPET